MTILDRIVDTKKEEITASAKAAPLAMLRELPMYQQPCVSVMDRISRITQPLVITEFKRRSPSKGWIHQEAKVEQVIPGYQTHGALAISVLTDEPYFGGSLKDLQTAAALVNTPLLRKDFMIDPYQLHEAKAYGASIILLIAAILTPAQVQEMAAEAKSLGLSILLELHDESELQHCCPEVDLVGINNRNLKTFAVNLDQSIRLAAALPKDKCRIAESGIHDATAAVYLKRQGFDGFLIGEQFMKQPDPAIAFAGFKQSFQQQMSLG